MEHQIPELNTILEAYRRIHAYIHKTPVLTSDYINRLSGANIYFKCENFQKVGAFKFRGAINAVLQIPSDKKKNGVATHSSGNHAQALALAARQNDTRAFIVMPENAPSVKVEAVRNYGASIFFCKPTLKDREETLESVIRNTGACLIHPYNNYQVIAGQATAAYELFRQTGKMDALVAPVGGGGLLSGTCLSGHYLYPDIEIFGAEPEGAADAYASLAKGEIVPSVNPVTIADGLLTSLGDKTFPIIRKHTKRIILVNEEEIISAMRLLWERMKIIVEPSGAVPLAAILKEKEYFKNKTAGVILSGGNVDLGKLPFK